MSTQTAAPAKEKFRISQATKGDVFSEVSRYIYDGVSPKSKKMHILRHVESGIPVELEDSYIEGMLIPGNHYVEEVRVGREDKFWTEKQIADAVKAGDLRVDHNLRAGDVRVKGIRTIWQEIYDSHALTCCYLKQDKPLSKKELESRKAAQIATCLDAILKAQKNKDGVAKAAEVQLKELQDNPILPYEKGDERILCGYKIQFESRDGRYDCVDLTIDT